MKRGRDDNEMTRYRYDVFLYMGEAAEPVKVSTSLDWTSVVGDMESLQGLGWKRAPRLWKCWAFLNALGAGGPVVLAGGTASSRRNGGGASRTRRGVDLGDRTRSVTAWEVGERLGYGVCA